MEHHRSTARGFDEEGHVEMPFALDVLLLRPAQEVSSKLDCSLRNGEYRVYYTVLMRNKTYQDRKESIIGTAGIVLDVHRSSEKADAFGRAHQNEGCHEG